MTATGKEGLYVSEGGNGKATVTAQEVADLAPASAGSLPELTDVTMGLIAPLAASHVLLCLTANEESDLWTNIDFNTLLASAFLSVASTYPGFSANQVLAVNATADGFVWVAP